MSYYPLNPIKINPFYLLFIPPNHVGVGWFFKQIDVKEIAD
jgi:hypothetical protein